MLPPHRKEIRRVSELLDPASMESARHWLRTISEADRVLSIASESISPPGSPRLGLHGLHGLPVTLRRSSAVRGRNEILSHAQRTGHVCCSFVRILKMDCEKPQAQELYENAICTRLERPKSSSRAPGVPGL